MSPVQAPQLNAAEADFLADLNRVLPQGIDWKQGALDYLAALLNKDNGDLERRFHLIKPFGSVYGDTPINQMLQEFVREISHFLNVIAILSVSPQSRFLDVACGSGWLTHFLAKLNLAVVGIDISDDMIALAKERLEIDPIPTVESQSFDRVHLLVHDIEQAPIAPEHRCDVAILESALHHFVNPIQSLRNIASSLSDRGLVVILEAATESIPPQHIEVMKQYRTLERPYSRSQMEKILQFAGFAEYAFLHPVNGFFPQNEAVAGKVYNDILHSQGWNTVIAAKQAGTLGAIGIPPTSTTIPTPAPVVPTPEPTPTISAEADWLMSPPPQRGIKGDLQEIASLSKQVVKKTIGKFL
jgi:SAM-dependent methyltransferase